MNTYTYEHITDRITSLLHQGTVPWHKPWKAQTSLPRNYVSGKPYRGINVFLLLALSYESPFWLTLRQANQLGGSIRKGEKSCPVIFWKQPEKVIPEAEADAPEQRKIPLLRFYHVFNLSQCEGINAVETASTLEADTLSLLPAEIVAQMPQRPVIKHGLTRSFYSPGEDWIGMPEQARFESVEHYYATLFHELIHATGHEQRLNRNTITESAGFGSNPYCKEELIAEMGAAFLCGHADIVERTIDNSAAYLDGWLKQLQSDKTLIVHAAAQAQKAADFILGHTKDATVDNTEVAVPVPLEVAT